MTNAGIYGTVLDAWRNSCQAEWSDYTKHEFVRSLADGQLPDSAYLAYLKQDYLFLGHFARAWGLAAAKAQSLPELRLCSAILDSLINEELDLHVETCAKAGIAESELASVPEEVETLAYTRFVLAAGYGGDFLDLMAALAPCVIGYGEIGARLSSENTSSRYSDWIDCYGGDAYQSDCRDFGALLDVSVVERLGDSFRRTPRWTSLCELFRTATILEANFWEMGLRLA